MFEKLFFSDINDLLFAEEFGTSSEKVACEQNCPEPCEHVEYETSFSYSALQTNTLVDHLMDYLNDTENKSVDRAIYEPLLNMTKSEREKYIEYVFFIEFFYSVYLLGR